MTAVTLAAAARAVAVTAVLLAGWAEGGCPFQNPFWFVEKPIVVPVKAGSVKSVSLFHIALLDRNAPLRTRPTPR